MGNLQMQDLRLQLVGLESDVEEGESSSRRVVCTASVALSIAAC